VIGEQEGQEGPKNKDSDHAETTETNCQILSQKYNICDHIMIL